jgi:acetyltransferase-like isoleucine patch superfamily enzyme
MAGEIVGVEYWTSLIGHDRHYFMERGCFVDCRGKLQIAATSMFGYGVRIITQTHDISEGAANAYAQNRCVRVDDYAWIASFALLFGCHVGDHAIVSAGSVVSGVVVPSYCMVQGNPSCIVARFNHELQKWVRLETPVACPVWKERK